MRKLRLEGFISYDTEGLAGRTIANVKKEFPNITFLAYHRGNCMSSLKENPAPNTRLKIDCYIRIELPKKEINKFKRKYRLTQ